MDTDWWINALIYACLVPSALFAALYASRSVWYSSWTGRWALSQSLSLFVLLSVIALAITFPDWSARPYVRLVSYGALFLTQWGGVAVLIYQQTRKPPTQLK